MRIDLQNRILRVASAMKTASDHSKFIQTMREISSTLTRTSDDMKQALKTRNTSLLARAINENKKAVDQMSYVVSSIHQENL